MKIAMLLVYFLVMISVGIYCRRHATNVHGFVLGGRSVGPWFTAFAYGTSYFSAVIFVGYAGQFGWRYGISAMWIGIGNALLGSLLAWIVLGRRTRIITQHLNASTMPQFFAQRFHSPSLRLGSSIIIFIFLLPYSASLYNGLSRLFEMAFDINYAVCIITMSLLSGIYIILGGYMATAINDFIQGIIMLIGIIAIIGALLSFQGGFSNALFELSHISDPTVSSAPGIFTSFFGPEPLNLLSLIFLTSFGSWALPQMVQKFYAIESEDSIKKGTVISTIFACIVAGGSYFLGGFGRLFSDQVDVAANGYDSIVPTMLSNLPTFFMALAIVLVLSASLSTLSSLVLTSSSTIVMDFCKQTFTKKANDKIQLSLIRLFIILFLIFSTIIAIVQYNSNVTFIAQLMGISWGALSGAFLAPFLYGLYWKRTTSAACWFSFISATSIMTINLLFRATLPVFFQSPVNCGVFAMLFNLVMVPLVSFLTSPPEKEVVNNAFSCYEKETTAHLKDTLGSN